MLAGLLTALYLAVTPMTAQTPEMFREVPSTHWAYGAIRQLAWSGLAEAYPADYFNGERQLSRFEFAMVTECAFSNVWDEAWLTEPGFEIRVLNQVEQLEPNTSKALLQLIEEFKVELVAVGKSVRGVRSSQNGPITISNWFGLEDSYVDHDGRVKYREIPHFGPLLMKRRGLGPYSGIY